MNRKNKMKHEKFISIKAKLLGVILPVMMLIIVVLISLSYYISKRVVSSNTSRLLETSVESQASEIQGWLDRNLDSFRAAKQAFEWTNLSDGQRQSFLNAFYNFNSNFPDGLLIADRKGRVYRGREATRTKADVVLREPDRKGNYIVDGGFQNRGGLGEKGSWQFMTALEGKAQAEIKNGGIVIHTKAEGTADYSVQLVQPSLPMEEGVEYRLRFDAYADEERMIKVGVSAPDRDYRRYLEDTTVNLTKEKQTFTYKFTMPDSNDANGRLEFNLGAMGSTADVRISNVSLAKTDHTSAAGSNDADAEGVTQAEWFKEGLSRVNMGFTDAYTNEEGERVISACGMLRYGGSDDVYVISAEMSLDKISVMSIVL